MARIQPSMKKKSKACEERKPTESLAENDQLKSYPAPWKGQLLLACAKCQKKLRRKDANHPLGRLGKSLKQCAREDIDHFRLRVIEVPCLKLCPKDGVTVCTQAQLGRAECSILRTVERAQQLYLACKVLAD